MVKKSNMPGNDLSTDHGRMQAIEQVMTQHAQAIPKYKYEVAFSCLKEDEPYAHDLYERLTDRLPVFLYTEKQKELAGTDGQVSFRQVFEEEARMVVILYRSKWGKSKWTRVEENAIKDRRFNHASDFVFFINMDVDQPQKPEWLSTTHIRLKASDHTPEEVAAIIAYRVRHLGGSVRQETVQDLSARLHREHLRAQEFVKLYLSKEGVALAHEEAESLLTYLDGTVTALEGSNQLELGKLCHKGRHMRFWYSTVGIDILWVAHNHGMLRGSRLKVSLVRVDHSIRFQHGDTSQFETLASINCRFSRDGTGLYGWQDADNQGSFILSNNLVDDWLKRFLAEVHATRMDETMYLVNNDGT